MTQRRPPRHRGFTLMEVLLVLVILVILGSLVVNVFLGTGEQAKIKAATAQTSLVETAVDLYHLDMSEYPNTLEDLALSPTDVANPNKWGGPYVKRRVSLDPWGNEYQFVAPGQHNQNTYDFWSYGPDGADGTEDDIGNWESNTL